MKKYFFIIIAVVALQGCGRDESELQKKELLIYCGITMIKPMTEIKSIIETQENCKITITKGGSGNLLKALKLSGIGDLYLPGSDSYIKKCDEENLITDSILVGYNQAAIMVQKDNPKNISPDLENFTNKSLFVVIGNPDSGSIGKETKKILQGKGIFDSVLNNARIITVDSKNLFQLLKNGEADLVINWYAVSVWDEHKDDVTAIKIDEKYAEKKKLVIGLLKTSKYPEIAKKLMDYAAGENGKLIFAKYGLGENK